jgi:hypothetical protein
MSSFQFRSCALAPTSSDLVRVLNQAHEKIRCARSARRSPRTLLQGLRSMDDSMGVIRKMFRPSCIERLRSEFFLNLAFATQLAGVWPNACLNSLQRCD